MTLAWRSMISWRAGLVVVVVIVAMSRHPIIVKIRRRSDRPRSGTLEVLSDGKDAEFDIIAVHGLGADPDRTWTQSVKTPQQREAIESQPTQYSGKIHLLQDLLKSDFPAARILSFKYNSNWLTDAPVKTTEEIGKRLLEEIKAKRSRPHLPIVFIGHSLGGIIIKQALCRPDSEEIINDTPGIIFLGTPHQGSPASISAAALAYMTRLLGSDTTMVLSLMSNEVQLTNLADTFRTRIAPKESRRQKPRIISFYETKPMYLLRFLSLGLIVSRNSAVLHADEVHDVDTDHSGLNKCAGQEDELYTQLKAAIDSLRAPSLLKRADKLIRDKRYAPKELKIERLSGDPLPMNQCYINLAIVEQSGQVAGRLDKGGAASSQFSLFAREKVETPDKAIQVNLATIFNQRKALDGRMVEPRRILIRGRAGVGKTTLCKKMVYDFTYGTQTELYRSWTKLFDRVLWVPLRNLKPRHADGYTYNDLFYHEYFSREGEADGRRLAEELWQAVKDPHHRTTLFILDGLDEISHELGRGDDMARFLNLLFDQPNIIITSRPNARLPVNLRGLDLALETIGFYPNQVKDYIQNAFADPNTGEPNKRNVDKAQSFLQSHKLIQGLVRIPIQLDALCYTWEDIHPETPLNTMTDIYHSIIQRLWKKDVLKLEKQHEGKSLTAGDIDLSHVKDLVQDEICFLEGLAFTGLHNDAIDFPLEHQDAISKHFRSTALILNKTLPHLSFLRTSDPSSKNPSYHFLHLTFQEYFAAGYFVRHWRTKQELRCLELNRKRIERISPRKFLQEHKYSARYDVFWRFVSGLLEAEGAEEAEELLGFFNEIEAEPLDLLGPTHQRLVMHCLSEVHTSTKLPMRLALEAKLSQWLLFEIDLAGISFLAGESECPENLLCATLKSGPGSRRRSILYAMLESRRQLSESAIQMLVALLEEDNEEFQSNIATRLGTTVQLTRGSYYKAHITTWG
ncbi:peptidase C14 [Ilyonectria destructans]|nr:peptidase C14 [Ilyonectria destructans]